MATKGRTHSGGALSTTASEAIKFTKTNLNWLLRRKHHVITAAGGPYIQLVI